MRGESTATHTIQHVVAETKWSSANFTFFRYFFLQSRSISKGLPGEDKPVDTSLSTRLPKQPISFCSLIRDAEQTRPQTAACILVLPVSHSPFLPLS